MLFIFSTPVLMEQHALKNVYNRWNFSISFYLETSSGQNFNLYLNVVDFFNTSVNGTAHFQNVNSYLNINIYSCVETSGG
jgi:hypothetical protein